VGERLAVRNQIRRTEEELMERVAREQPLLQDHCGSADKIGGTLIALGIAEL